MVVAKDLGENIELSILIPIMDKPMRSVYERDGFSPKDLKSYGFNVVISKKDFALFVQDLMDAYLKIIEAAGKEGELYT